MFSGDFLYPAAGWEDLLSPPGGLYAAQPGTDMYAYLEAMLKASSHSLLVLRRAVLRPLHPGFC